ncbi:MAG: dicarboxylate/amino acid:cation symporter [Rikenellaceae bacterium]
MINFNTLAKLPLLIKVLIAITLGIICSLFTPLWCARIFETINAIFSQYLAFVIPLVILGLVAPSISELGSRAGKMLLATTLIAFGSTIFSGYISYFVASATYPQIIANGILNTVDVTNVVSCTPYFTIPMPPIMSVTSALVLAFVLGLTISTFADRDSTLARVIGESKEVVMLIINRSIIPLLPLFIFGIFLKLGVEGSVASVLGLFMKVVCIIFALHIVLLLTQFTIAGAIAKRNPFKTLYTMLPAYLTALGTQSSAATIPVTLECCRDNRVRSDVAEFIVPLCATIHLSGSILKIVACAMAISWSSGMATDISLYTGFIFMLAITMIAAPGLPGGAIMAAMALLSSQLGFDETQCGLMVALYIAMDSFGTAGNVTGDGAIALIVNKIYSKPKNA